MAEELYNLMDWQKIEALVYSEENEPQKTLRPKIMKNGILFQCFFPGAQKVKLLFGKKKQEYKMEMQDEAGFFACLVPEKQVLNYVYQVLFESGEEKLVQDPYYFESQITKEEEKKFCAGIYYDIYEKLGAHYQKIKGVWGVHFAVWAPNALRVSVVGDFNHWDGRIHQMNRLSKSGIFELFIPGVKPSDLYKYEIKTKDLRVFLKSDPYANQSEVRPCNASVVTDLSNYQWEDSSWMNRRNKIHAEDKPFSVYEVHLGSWKKPEDGREFYNYRELAKMLCEYVKEMGYTHVELLPVMEHPLDESWGYQVTGYYAPTSRFGNCEDFMYFVDYMHQNDIGVILDWVPAHFPKDDFALAGFDGTPLYEYAQPDKAEHPHWGTLVFDYASPEVKNFLISSALFWTEKYHVDGIRMDAVASMLYLDYGRQDGQWQSNIYGGNENLEAVEFLKHLNSIFKKKYPDALLIAEESTAWPAVTGDLDDNGLGFDRKWNMGWQNDFLDYMGKDPIFRSGVHDELTFSMLYAYSEKFLLSFSHDEVVHGKGSFLNKMPGEKDRKLANLRVAYGFWMTHPGKKLLFMGQDFAQEREWCEKSSLDWELLKEKEHKQLQDYVKALLKLYKDYPALYEYDDTSDGFEWINHIEAEKNMLTFLRKGEKKSDTLVIVCNFSDVVYEEYVMGVPYAGEYREIFNSDEKIFGGTGIKNSGVQKAKKEEKDERPYSIKIQAAPLSVQIFSVKECGEKIVKKSKIRRELEQKMKEEHIKEENRR